ncbi:protein mono-ADP-ribosyltransferase PARP4 isoform X2 [Antennarius striatus]|uniref:protein mono-ADP-ribosyltransferase PARP4 isoform X2 n=1 Tax=Antennarius striatus TaxID=241820 RepID=UPI0035B168BB
MAMFENCYVYLELKTFVLEEKNKLLEIIRNNGGKVCYVVGPQCSLIVTTDVSRLSPFRLRHIQKYHTPVVGVDYIYNCVERGVLLPVDQYKLDVFPTSTPTSTILSGEPNETSKGTWSKWGEESSKRPAKPRESAGMTLMTKTLDKNRSILDRFRTYSEDDPDRPSYPDNFQVAKYSVFGTQENLCVLELQSFRGDKKWLFRVVRRRKDSADGMYFLSSSEDALEVYKALTEKLTASGLSPCPSSPPFVWDMASAPLRQLLLEEKLNAGSVSQEVMCFVALMWTEALNCLSNIVRVPFEHLSFDEVRTSDVMTSIACVARVEGLLIQAQKKMKEQNHAEVKSYLDEIYTLMPLREHPEPSASLLSKLLDLCQLIRDISDVIEMTLRNPSDVGSYRALRCSIEVVPPRSSDFQDVSNLLKSSELQILQVLRVCRGVELQTFRSDLGNINPLLHSSSPSNFVGLLSRGLLLPRFGVEHHGIQRTDVGNLGSGIYFTDDFTTCLKYSKPSETDGSRLLLVCDVALGRCQDYRKRAITLTQAPEGHHSAHGVRRTPGSPSEFEDDEYVVYSPDQVRLRYVVRFIVTGDRLEEFDPDVTTADEPCPPSSEHELDASEDGVEMVKNPLEDVKAGLLDSAGQQLPLQAVHVKCKLKDLLAQVIIFQKYTNPSFVPIEAKYVFPLADSAAVCAFEAFINGKHVVGEVKEKETAHKEYRQAIEKGHGAYLMDQAAPDVFTISVGNLPPGATVLIKVTFLSELIVRDGSILFSLPGRVAPWQESKALHQTTQVTLEKVFVTELASKREFSLDASVEMPYAISSLSCITHKIKTKKTDLKAVLSVLPDQAMGPEGFQLSITLSEVHLPRMWVEKHPDKDSQACMLVFYPQFHVDASSVSSEVILLLDTSESMMGEPLRMAQKIALQVLRTLDHNLKLNVVLFGTEHKEAFVTSRPLDEARQDTESFIRHLSPVGGGTELWRPLRALSLLPPSHGVRNLLLLSDGHIQNAELTAKLIRDNAQHSRLFTCGISTTANRHMLRILAQAGGGAFEFFNTKTKHKWAEQVASQVKRMASPCCSAVSVKWQQFSQRAPPPVQAPKQLHALFSDCHTLVYGFVPHCTQATLHGNLSGQEIQTMVSTSQLQTTRGTFLHKFTAKALIRDYEDGCLDVDEAEHEGKKAELKNFIIELSKEFSVLSQFTSFVAVEERDLGEPSGFTDVPSLVMEEDVDFLPYISWIESEEKEEEEEDDRSSSDSYEGMVIDEEESSLLRICEEDTAAVWETVSAEEGDEPYEIALGFISSTQNSVDVEDFPMDNFQRKESFHSRSFRRPLPERSVQACFASEPPPPPSSIIPPKPLLSHNIHRVAATPMPPSPYPLDFMRVPICGMSFAAASHPPPTPPQAPVSLPPPPPSAPHPRSISGDSLAPPPPPPPASAVRLGLTRPVSPWRVDVTAKSNVVVEESELAGFPEGLVAKAFPDRRSFSCGLRASEQELQASSGFGFMSPRAIRKTQRYSISSELQQGPPGPASVNREKSNQQPSVAKDETLSWVKPGLPDGFLPERKQKPRISEFTQLVRKKRLAHCSRLEKFDLSWEEIFLLQHPEGYWDLTTPLGKLIRFDVDVFANEFLKNKGICSLGVRAHADILRLVATLLVLQLMRSESLEEGRLLRTLFRLDSPPQPRPRRWEEVKKAVDWVCWADRQYPCIYSRLEFGWSWESATRQLLGLEGLPPFSALSVLKLRTTGLF